MTSRFERRLARVEKLRRPVPDPPDPRMFVIATLVRLPGSLSGGFEQAQTSHGAGSRSQFYIWIARY